MNKLFYYQLMKSTARLELLEPPTSRNVHVRQKVLIKSCVVNNMAEPSGDFPISVCRSRRKRGQKGYFSFLLGPFCLLCILLIKFYVPFALAKARDGKIVFPKKKSQKARAESRADSGMESRAEEKFFRRIHF
jgi:hypothetical protein